MESNASVVHFYKYGLILIKDNKILLCEPYAFTDLILPGGTKEGDESHVENLLREVEEELGVQAVLDLESLKYLDNFKDVAAGRTYRIVEIEAYLGNVNGKLTASSEIKNLRWFSPNDDWNVLSPIIRNKILPYLLENNYLSRPQGQNEL